MHMSRILEITLLLAGFAIVALASGQLSKLFRKIRLPLITGLILSGIITGPYLLDLIPREAVKSLGFLNDIALAFIALAVGSELYLKEIRDRIRAISWMTFTQMFGTFVLVSLAFYFVSPLLPFLDGMNSLATLAVSFLAATIFVARSPASAIAIVNEMRAKGPFTQTSLGVTVVKDFLVVILFSLIFTLSSTWINVETFTIWSVLKAVLEILLAFGFGYLYFIVIRGFFSSFRSHYLRIAFILLTGLLVYLGSHSLSHVSKEYIHDGLHIEPLLICIIGSFAMNNYSRFRNDFIKVVQDTGPFVYVVFFTFAGASIELDILAKVWYIALALFTVRIISLVIAGYLGASLAGDPPIFRRLSWMPYVTQAGVGLGLAMVVAGEYPDWGQSFATLMSSVIVLNQLVGPPLFKWALQLSGEARPRSDNAFFGRDRIAMIFGLESQSLALARRLSDHGWKVSVCTMMNREDTGAAKDVEIRKIDRLDVNELRRVEADQADTLICLLSDDENFDICQIARSEFNIRHIIVRLNNRNQYDRFLPFKVMALDPATAMLSLLEHYTRAPMATSLLLGMDKGQDTMDIRLSNPSLHGVTLRDLQLPMDVIVLSVSRREQIIISHGYTRLRLGDVVTLVGSSESLEQISLQFRG